jgi:hypothetical protein
MDAPNEANISPCETKRNDKPLKSLGAKSRDFAESFVFKGLSAFHFAGFTRGLGAGTMHARLS